MSIDSFVLIASRLGVAGGGTLSGSFLRLRSRIQRAAYGGKMNVSRACSGLILLRPAVSPLVLLAAFAAAAPGVLPAQTPPDVKHVLFLLATDPTRPGTMPAIRGISEELHKAGLETVSIHTETFVPKPGFEGQLRKTVKEKYRDVPVQAVMVTLSPLVKAAAELRDDLWPGIPLIYGVGETDFVPPPNSTGVVVASDLKGTLQVALQLFPKARRLVIAGGVARTDRAVSLMAETAARALKPGLEIVHLGGLSASEMKDRIAATPSDSIILLTAFNMVGQMHEMTDIQMVNLFAPVVKAPMFDIAEYTLGSGVVGGSVSRNEFAGAQAAKILLRVLHGERAESIPPIRIEPRLVLDWRQLQRFGVPKERVPRTAELLYRQPTLWEAHRVLLVGLFLAGFAQTLLILILFAERRARTYSQRKLAERLRYERLISEISAGFAALPNRIDERIDASLRRFAEFLGAERATLWWRRSGDQAFESIRSWALPAAGLPLPAGYVLVTDFTEALLAGQVTCVADVSALRAGSVVRAALERTGVRSALLIPLSTGGLPIGVISCSTLTRTQSWSRTAVENVQTLGELFANALALKESNQVARELEALHGAVLASLPGYVGILDRQGTILKFNDSWSAASGAKAGLLAARLGENYLEICRETAKKDASMSQVADLVASVLGGARQSQTVEVSQPVASGEQWLEIRLEPLNEEVGGAVISLMDVTARKRAELHAARNLETISHMNRVAAVSELASSIAHELNQPLAAIGLNAQAASMQLESPSPDLAELRAIAGEIVSDNRRAADVIRHARELMKRQERVAEPTDVNEMARKVVPLVRNDAVRRAIHLRLEFAADLPFVAADPVQLQQVVLNLVKNGMDALKETPPESRVLTIRTRHEGDTVLVDVEDHGHGIPEDALETIFASFYTTKPAGLGLGLAISRSIVEAYSGRLWAENRAGGGARFRISLPVAPAAARDKTTTA